MTSTARLAEIITALEAVGVSCLVRGGHAVRHYGLERNTIDFDLQVSAATWDGLPLLLARSTLARGQPLVEGPTWRPSALRCFQIGQLADGREDWLEFWSHNHLLPPFAELHAHREKGEYGGRVMAFLSLPGLIRSKETEHERDWQDIAILEEFLDARHLAQANAARVERITVLAGLRSRRGFERCVQQGFLADAALPRQALARASLPVTQAYLLPFAPDVSGLPSAAVVIEPVVLKRLRSVAPASPLHLSLVELVRRQYKAAMQAPDRADKAALRAAPGRSLPRP